MECIMRSLTVCCALIISAMGCAHDIKPPQTAPGAPMGVVSTTTSRSLAQPGATNGVSLSADLRRVCGIEDTGAAPKFDFDATVLSPADRNQLEQLATCMTSGALAGKNVELVGRADPRGEVEYNMTLGEKRADAVEHYLAQLGVAPTRLPTTSRGALDAQGHDEATWAVDRRVDLRLTGR
jgi:peptidoglycan-associated lipoprotein